MVNQYNANVKNELRILTTSPIHGYGYRLSDFWEGIVKHRAHAVVIDAGSTDGGPSCLGIDDEFICAKESYVRDFGPMLEACHHLGVKIIISSSGGCGDDRSVDHFVNVVREMAGSSAYSFKVATIKTEVSKDVVRSHLQSGQIQPCGPVPELTEDALDNTVKIVAQIGPEPYLKVLREHPDVDIILGGRSYDPAPFTALAMYHGMGSKDNYGPARHMGKILECGGICARPKARSILAVLREDSFDLVPLHPTESVTPISAAAHSLYEKTRPDILDGPGGKLLLGNATYTPLPGGRVRCANAMFETTEYMVKLEGAQQLGYRTVFIGGVRDPILIEGIDAFLDKAAEYTTSLFPALQDGSASILWHVYGRDAVMGELEPVKATPHELGIMGEVVAQTQSLANAIANNVRVGCLHNSYPGQLATGGNFAIPLSPHEQPAGPVFRFSVYHLMPCADPADWPIEVMQLGVAPSQVAERDANYAPHYPQPQVVNFSQNGSAANGHATNGHAANGHKTNGHLNGEAKDSTTPNTLRYLAKVVRSKNSGPFEVTMDVMFDTEEVFDRAERSGVLNRKLIKRLYSVPDDKILTCMFFRPALAWKMTIVRPREQGSIGETDTFGTAQHAPLLDVEIPL